MIAISKPSVDHWEELRKMHATKSNQTATEEQREMHATKSNQTATEEQWEKHKKLVINRFSNMNVTVSTSVVCSFSY
jgi:phage regulator Rha-like protein